MRNLPHPPLPASHPHPRPAGLRRAGTLIALLATACGLALPTGCASNQPGQGAKVTLKVFWWGGPERARMTEKVLELYHKRHPSVSFEPQWQVNPGYYDKLAEMAAGGKAPDIFQIDDNYLGEYTSRGLTKDLTSHLARKQIDTSRFPAGLSTYGKIDNVPYAVPNAANTPALIYDRTVVQELGMAEPQIGWTYERLVTWAAEITKKTNSSVYGTMDPSGDYKTLWVWLRSQGKELYSNARLGFTAEDLTRWFDLWVNARRRSATPPAEIVAAADTSDITKQLVVTKQGATVFGWSNMLAELQKSTDHQLGITAFPGDPRGQWARASQYWSIYRRSPNADAAADVINFLVNDPSAGKILGTDRGLPANLDIRSEVTPSLSGAMRATVRFEEEMAARFGPPPGAPPKGHGMVRTLLLQSAQHVQWGRMTPRQAAQEFMSQAATSLGG